MVTLDSKSPFQNYAMSLLEDMPHQVALVMGLMVFTALFEGVSLLLLVPMLQIVGLDTGNGNLGYIAGSIAYAFSAFSITPTLEIILILYIAVVSLQSRLNRLQSNLSSKIQYNFITHLRVRFYNALTNADYLYLSRKRSSDLAQLLMQETDRVGYGTFQILNLAANIIISLVYVMMAFRLSAPATVLALISGICLALLLRERTERSRIAGRKIFQSNKSLFASALEHMAALKTTKSYSAERRNAEIFSRQAEEIGQGNIGVFYLYALVANLYETGSVIALSAILYVSITFLDVPLASLLILLFLFARLMPKFSTIQGSYQRFIALLPAFSALDETVREMEEAAEVKTKYEENEDEVTLGRSVEFRDVCFAYDNRTVFDRD
ncbi:MAG: ABC transporter ATP-binding protein [Methanothrix sp.]